MTGQADIAAQPAVLTLASLYPNNVSHRNGVFVRERVRQLRRRHPMPLTVVAPVPWFPSGHAIFGRYAGFARVHLTEQDQEITVYHPRYFMLPRIGDLFSPMTYARAVLRLIEKRGIGRIDLIDAHYFFPDGAAAVIVARKLGCPVLVTARGSDINVMPDEFAAGRWIRWAAKHCTAAAGVSQALCDGLASLGVERGKLHALPNGVDGERFGIRECAALRARLAPDGPLVISVGNLIPLKGHHLAIEAIAGMPRVTLAIVGDGPMRGDLEDLARRLDVHERVVFAGEIGQDSLVDYYNAADVLVLASASEGMPNVVLEAMSCGTPVVATPVGGAQEILAAGRTGRLLQRRDAASIRDALTDILRSPGDRHETRRETSPFDWAHTSGRIAALFAELTTRNG